MVVEALQLAMVGISALWLLLDIAVGIDEI
jgi:hypothetical protein